MVNDYITFFMGFYVGNVDIEYKPKLIVDVNLHSSTKLQNFLFFKKCFVFNLGYENLDIFPIK